MISPTGKTVANDPTAPPQNNAFLVYNPETGDWFLEPNYGASALCVWKGEEDNNEFYVGDYNSSIFLMDTIEGLDDTITRNSFYGQATNVLDDDLYLDDSGGGFTSLALIGYTIYIVHVSHSIDEDYRCESRVIAANTTTRISWAVADPLVNDVQLDDYYIILKETEAGNMSLKYHTPSFVIKSMRELKWFIDMIVRVFGTGRMIITYSFDESESGGGLFEINLSQGSTFLGTHKLYSGAGATPPLSKRLYLTAWDVIMSELSFPNNQGRTIKFAIETETNQTFELTMLSFGYKIHQGGTGWLP